jgi:hypothetical protein
MRILGLSELGRRAQRVMRDDAACGDLLGVETDGEFSLYSFIVPPGEPDWMGFYSLTTRITPVSGSYTDFCVSHRALNGAWLELDVQGSFEFCVRQVLENRYHLFFD